MLSGVLRFILLLIAALPVVPARAAARSATEEAAAAEVQALVPLSLGFVDGAMATLSQGWTGMSEAERDAFLQIYDPAGTGEIDERFVAQVLENYGKIRRTMAGDMRVDYAPFSARCEGQRLYYIYPSHLLVCPYFFAEQNDLRKARTLIHEMAHRALWAADRPYYRPTSKQYAALTPNGSWMTGIPLAGRLLRELLRGDTLYHPDAYAHFALLNAGYTNIYAPADELKMIAAGKWREAQSRCC